MTKAAKAAAEEPPRAEIAFADGAMSYLAWDDAGPDRPALVFTHANGFNANTYRTCSGL